MRVEDAGVQELVFLPKQRGAPTLERRRRDFGANWSQSEFGVNNPFKMHRNMYDTDVTVWSPEGRLLQVREGMVVPRGGEKLK